MTLTTTPNRPPIGGAVLIGFLVLLMFFGGFIAWAGRAPLQSAAVATGSVNLDTYRKTVQHYEGGIIKDILIREGQDVDKDQVLIVLDETQARSKIELLKAQISAEKQRLSFINERIEAVAVLLEKGHANKPQILELYGKRAEMEGNTTVYAAQLRAAEHVVARAKIRAPISGTVVGLQVHTSGGVIKAGESLLSIVPRDEPLVVEARVDPNDIDVVHKGLPAQVRLTPFNTRMIPPVPASVVWISADSMNDPNTGASYYLARVRLANQSPELPADLQLYPGMPAEVMVVTGERTLLNYLAAPLMRSFRRAFLEQ
ncbi:MAG: HlyD family efflux transporter periplasmic adaptor subunit [Pseudomonadota bacterium]